MLREHEVICRFNTQPPKGGWGLIVGDFCLFHSFNTQPPKGGWMHALVRQF